MKYQDVMNKTQESFITLPKTINTKQFTAIMIQALVERKWVDFSPEVSKPIRYKDCLHGISGRQKGKDVNEDGVR